MRSGRAAWLVLLLIASAAPAQPPDSTSIRQVRPGVIERTLVRSAGPWRIHILTIDLTRRELSLRSAHAFDRLRGRETTSSIASRFPARGGTVVAALNADFFALETGETVNNQVAEGAFVKGIGLRHALPRSQFGITWDRSPFIDRLRYRGTVIAPGAGPAALDGLNTLPDSGGVSLITAWWGGRLPDSAGTHPLRRVRLQEAGRRTDTLLFTLVQGEAGSGDTLSCALLTREDSPHPFVRALHSRDTLCVVEGTAPPSGRIRTLVGGAPRIVLDGESVAGKPEFMEGTSAEFSRKRHPRTGIGFSQDSSRVFFLVVDGRQQGSAGMTLPEFADLMIEAGVWQGLNLDGGGSTVMIVGGNIVNSPSDPGGERPVANCLLLVADPLEGEPAR